MITRRASAAAAELSVVWLSVVSLLNLDRLFADRTALGELITVAILGHIVAISTRRAGLRTFVAAPLSLAVTALALKLLLYPETGISIDGIRATLSLLSEDLGAAWDLFQTEKAPVESARGLVAVAAAVLGLGAFVVDWAAFRLRSVIETLIVPSAVFVFASLLGGGEQRVAYGALFAASAAALIATMRTARRLTEEIWVADGASRAVTIASLVGCATILAAVTVGAVTAPLVRGSGETLLDLNDIEDRSELRSVVSPLVEVPVMLVDQTDFPLFSVKVDRQDRDYWRLMALTEFDGAIWRRHSSFRDVDGEVPTHLDSEVPRRLVRQEITTRRLGNVYLPAAFELKRVVDSGSVVLEYEPATGALVVDRASTEAAARGFTYIVESAVPDFDTTQLPAVATDGLDDEFVAEHTQLPPACGPGTGNEAACWPERVSVLAREITQGALSDYERALALQAFFTGPDSDFVYDLDVAKSHDIETVSDFLFDARRGYCEQFATSFAAMARSLGIPARVAVGFTWGDWDEARGEYVVRGKHAHAWTELYFAGAGWIAFEPTPGRGPAHGISGRSPAQEGDVGGSDDVAPAPTTTAAPAPTSTAAAAGSVTTAPADPAEPAADELASGGDEGGDGTSSRIWQILLRAALAIVLVSLLVGAVPTAKWLVRRRRLKAAADDPLRRGELAFDDAVAALRLIGIVPAAAETAQEFADRVRGLQGDCGPVDDLAAALTWLRYSPASEEAAEIAATAQSAAEGIRRSCRERIGILRDVADLFDPRPLVAGIALRS